MRPGQAGRRKDGLPEFFRFGLTDSNRRKDPRLISTSCRGYGYKRRMQNRPVNADKMSEREAARQFGPARETVRKMLRYAAQTNRRCVKRSPPVALHYKRSTFSFGTSLSLT